LFYSIITHDKTPREGKTSTQIKSIKFDNPVLKNVHI